VRLVDETLDLLDDVTAVALRDGVIDAAEQHVIDRTRFIAAELERGNLARLLAQSIENSWRLTETPKMARQIRELLQDLGPEAA